MKLYQPFHFTYGLSLFLTGLVFSKAGVTHKQKNDMILRILKVDDILPARRTHQDLTGTALKEELAVISEALNDMIKICNDSYTTPLRK